MREMIKSHSLKKITIILLVIFMGGAAQNKNAEH